MNRTIEYWGVAEFRDHDGTLIYFFVAPVTEDELEKNRAFFYRQNKQAVIVKLNEEICNLMQKAIQAGTERMPFRFKRSKEDTLYRAIAKMNPDIKI